MSGNNLPKTHTPRQPHTTPLYMHVENVLKPANEFRVKSWDTEKRSRWSSETAKERHRLRRRIDDDSLFAIS